MQPSRSRVGDLLRRYRGRTGLTQEALAERAGLSVTGISKIERGIHPTPRCETIHLLANALRLSPDDRIALEQSVGRLTLTIDRSASDQSVPLSAVLQAISSLAGLSDGVGTPPAQTT